MSETDPRQSYPEPQAIHESNGDGTFGDVMAYQVRGHIPAEQFIGGLEWAYALTTLPDKVQHRYYRYVPQRDGDGGHYGILQRLSKPGRGVFAVTEVDREHCREEEEPIC